VTEQEELAAKNKIAEIHKKLNAEYKPPPLPAFITGRVTSTKTERPMEKTNPVVVRPELTRLYDAVLAANTAMCATADNEDMFAAVTKAAIGIVIKEAGSVVTNIETTAG
jgi:hypothetical protein